MGLLDGALNLVKSVYNSVTGSDTSKKPAGKTGTKTNSSSKTKSATKPKMQNSPRLQQKCSSVFNEKQSNSSNNQVGDVVVTTKSSDSKATNSNAASQLPKTAAASKTAQKTVSKQSSDVSRNNNAEEAKITFDDIIKMQEQLVAKCKECGIDYEETIDEALQIAGFNEVKFDEVEQKDKMKVLLCMEFLISSKVVANGRDDNKQNDALKKFINHSSRLYFEYLKKYSYEDMKMVNKIYFDEMMSIKEKYSEELTKAEKEKLFYNSGKNIRMNIKKYADQKVNETKDETKRKKIQAKARSLKDDTTNLVVIGASNIAKPADKKYALYAVESNKLVPAVDLLNEHCGQEVVDSLDIEYWHDAYKFRKNHDDEIEIEEYGNVLHRVGELMSNDALNKFNQDSYEYKLNCKNGEIDEPLPEELLTQESIAIGFAIATNVNLTASQKAELLKQWNTYASSFSDYDDVKNGFDNAIAEFLEEHPEAEGMVDELRAKVEQGNNSSERADCADATNNQSYVSKAEFYANNDTQQNGLIVQSKKTEKELAVSAKSVISSSALKNELKEKTVNEVLSSYSNSVYEIIHTILHNDKELIGRLDEIIPRLEGYSGKDIGNMAYGCDTKVISKLITEFPEKSKDILNIVTSAMCYSGRQLAKQKVEKQNEAA